MFTVPEVGGLAFELGLNEQALEGQGIEERAVSLLRHAKNVDRLNELEALIRRDRPEAFTE